jgi:hypothetical protein
VRGPPPSHPEWPAGVSGGPSILVHRLALAWTIGVVVLVIGAILAVAGFAGWEIGGRTHWYWAAAAVVRGFCCLWSQAATSSTVRLTVTSWTPTVARNCVMTRWWTWRATSSTPSP